MAVHLAVHANSKNSASKHILLYYSTSKFEENVIIPDSFVSMPL